MVAAFVEWATSFWGIVVLVSVAWFALSCGFALVIGGIIADFGDAEPSQTTGRHRPSSPKPLYRREFSARGMAGAGKKKAAVRVVNGPASAS